MGPVMTTVDETVGAIRAGEPVLLPTDTVYGLCADPFREEPALRVAQLKGREATQPIALLLASVDAAVELVPGAARARRLLPGPYTLVLPNPERRFPWLAGGRPDAIGLRVPDLPETARTVVERVGAVLATSANRHGGTDPRRLADVPAVIRSACAAELDAGELPGIPSTVIDLTGREPRVVREGAVPAAEALLRLR
jgi:L-threonylcarbamoyladenylate synthase